MNFSLDLTVVVISMSYLRMSVFKDSDEIHTVIGGFFKLLAQDAVVGPKLLNSNLKLKFHYKEPNTNIFIDLSGNEAAFAFNDQEHKADVEMTMKADVAHKFWQGKVNLVTSLARREITAKGPIPKILKLLPIIKPAYSLYPKYLEDNQYLQSDS